MAVVTCNHVVPGVVDPVYLGEDDSNPSEVVFRDRKNDLAILRPTHKLPGSLVLLAFDSPPPIGAGVVVVGDALGFLSKTVTQGIYSGVRADGDRAVYQHSAAVSPGMSGGPLMTISGRVFGVVASRIEGEEGLGFASDLASLRTAIESASFILRDAAAPGKAEWKSYQELAWPELFKPLKWPCQMALTSRSANLYDAPAIKGKPHGNLVTVLPKNRALYVWRRGKRWTSILISPKGGDLCYVQNSDIKLTGKKKILFLSLVDAPLDILEGEY
ncbi:hypothetical protein BH11ARM2_BH11ARM2_35170 [soil metagenome]